MQKVLSLKAERKQNCKKETGNRIARATAKFNELGNVLRDKEINLSVRRKLLEACVRPRLTYAVQSWRPTRTTNKKVRVMLVWFSQKNGEGGISKKTG